MFLTGPLSGQTELSSALHQALKITDPVPNGNSDCVSINEKKKTQIDQELDNPLKLQLQIS